MSSALRSALWVLAAIPSVPVLLASCAGSRQMQVPPVPVETDGFAVAAPDGDDWETTVNADEGSVVFMKPVKWVTGARTGTVVIRVFENSVLEEKWHLSETEIADDYRRLELQVMNDEGVAKGHYRILESEMGTEIIDGRTYYTLSYSLTSNTSWFWGGGDDSNATLYLFFPPDFKTTHRFFGFLAQRAYVHGALAKGSLDHVEDVMSSFVIR